MEKEDDDDLNRFLEAVKINYIEEIEDELKKGKTAWIIFWKKKNVNVYVQEKCINFMFLKWNGFIKIKSVKIEEELLFCR